MQDDFEEFLNSGAHRDLDDLEELSKKYGLDYVPPVRNRDSLRDLPGGTGEVRFVPKYPKANTPPQSPHTIYAEPDRRRPSAAYTPEGKRVVYAEEEQRGQIPARLRQGKAEFTRPAANYGSAVFGQAYNEMHRTTPGRPAQNVNETPVAGTRVIYDGSSDRQSSAAPRSASRRAIDDFTNDAIPAPKMAKRPVKKRNPLSHVFPWKGDSAKEVIRKLIMDISALLVIGCFVYFVQEYLAHRQQIEVEQAHRGAVTEVATEDNLELRWAEIRKKYPDVDFPQGMNIRFADMYAKNQDMVGWLTVPGTNIDTCVLHYPGDTEQEGDEDYYLHRDFYKKYNKYGNPYLDGYNTGSSLDPNNTIYGHNMMDGLMFAQLEKYYTLDGFRSSPVIKYSTLFEDYVFKVYAVIISNGYPEGDNGYLFNYTNAFFPSDANYADFIRALDERKLYDTGVDINPTDKLLTLSTCSYEIKSTDMGRLAVVGRLVRPGESTKVDTSLAKENPNVRYPQIWYDEHGTENPWANAQRWMATVSSENGVE